MEHVVKPIEIKIHEVSGSEFVRRALASSRVTDEQFKELRAQTLADRGPAGPSQTFEPRRFGPSSRVRFTVDPSRQKYRR